MSDHRQLKKQTRALLSGLGTCPDEVAESLQAAGVHGVPKNNRGCAIAVYLTALMGPDRRIRSVNVGHCSLLIDTAVAPDFQPAGRLQVQLPKPVRQFIAAFDAQNYPTITRGPSRAPLTSIAAVR
jgi:hypothetical protein